MQPAFIDGGYATARHADELGRLDGRNATSHGMILPCIVLTSCDVAKRRRVLQNTAEDDVMNVVDA